jgi:hypothetical protein
MHNKEGIVMTVIHMVDGCTSTVNFTPMLWVISRTSRSVLDKTLIRDALLLQWVSEWVNDCCLTPIQQFFSYILARTS